MGKVQGLPPYTCRFEFCGTFGAEGLHNTACDAVCALYDFEGGTRSMSNVCLLEATFFWLMRYAGQTWGQQPGSACGNRDTRKKLLHNLISTKI